MTKFKLDLKSMCCWAMTWPLCILLVGCGGAESDGNAGTGSTTTVSGIAATGKPVNGGIVQMACAKNTAGPTVISNADGFFSVRAPGTAPCVIRVSGGDIVGGEPLFSVVTSSAQTHANVNQLTTMLASLLAGGDPDVGLFQSPTLIQSKITPTAATTFKEMIRTNVVANLGASVGVPTDFDFLEGAFVANNLGFDLMLDKIGFVPGATPSIMFNGNPMLTVNAATGVASATTSTVVSNAAFNATGFSGSAHTIVTTAKMRNWSFINDCGVGTPAGALVRGPVTPALGAGSAQLTIGASNECMILATQAYSGTMLSQLTSMQYASSQSGPTAAPALQFDVRYHPADTVYQGRLVFEPYQNGAVVVGSGWQNWDALNGKWWASKTTAAASNGLCSQATPCTWSQVQANWPGASILGNTLFKVGSGWAAFSGNVDAFAIGIAGITTTYDFE